MSAVARDDEAGFTLVEVLVALAILALSLSVLLGLVSAGLRQTSRAESLAEAGSLAQSLLARAGTDVPIRQGLASGKSANGFRWRLRMEPYGATAGPDWPVGAYSVSAEVSWDDGPDERSFVLTTLRLGPREPPR